MSTICAGLATQRDSRAVVSFCGDTPTTIRIFNAFATESIILAPDKELPMLLAILPFRSAIPWRNIIRPVPTDQFDRVVSVEMFEHLRNWHSMLDRIDSWLRPGGQAFFHVFCHRHYPYLFAIKDGNDWMSQHFFTGGLMPSADLFHHFQDQLVVADHWYLNGMHYAHTARHWLNNMDRNRGEILSILEQHYGEMEALIWFQRWRMFFMSCEELWGLDRGEQWGVTHYLLRKRPTAVAPAPADNGLQAVI